MDGYEVARKIRARPMRTTHDSLRLPAGAGKGPAPDRGIGIQAHLGKPAGRGDLHAVLASLATYLNSILLGEIRLAFNILMTSLAR